jgi:hypothetical protein
VAWGLGPHLGDETNVGLHAGVGCLEERKRLWVWVWVWVCVCVRVRV